MATYVGTVKSWNPDKGWGHLECEQTHATFGKDVFVMKSQLKLINVLTKGEQVSFEVTDSGRGPEANNVMPMTQPSVAYANQAQYYGQPAGAATGQYVGVVKNWNKEKGWGMIESEQITQLYAKDMFFMKSQVQGNTAAKGWHVRFDVIQGTKGFEATNVVQVGTPQPQQRALQVPAWNQASRSHMPGLPSGTPAARTAAPAQTTATQSQVFCGTVKSFQEEKGWGHIQCDQTHAMYQKDIFFMRSALNNAPVSVGDRISFAVEQGTKGPQGANVQVTNTVFTQQWGTIKLYNPEKGYGFIQCDATRHLFNKDIFVHSKELAGATPNQGDTVNFTVEISPQGRPEAINVSLNGAHPPANGGLSGYGLAAGGKGGFRQSPYY